MLYFLQRSFMKALEPSSSAAPFLGPKAGMPASSRSSASPATRGASGPITTMPMSFSRQKVITAGWSATLRSSMVVMLGSWLIPALPGAQNRVLQSGDWASFHARACSRPPVPTTSTFIFEAPFPLPLPFPAAQRGARRAVRERGIFRTGRARDVSLGDDGRTDDGGREARRARVATEPRARRPAPCLCELPERAAAATRGATAVRSIL
mmetsp:Transcript_5369/g.14926  ORF Transcript_5369/g.14926 Transcript_5369/m.14926 type:complete len:209 (-) Transcript_5369:89-715(-)